MCEYHGQAVFSEWQSWQARCRMARTGAGTSEPARRGGRWSIRLEAPPDVVAANASATEAATVQAATAGLDNNGFLLFDTPDSTGRPACRTFRSCEMLVKHQS